MLRGRSLEGLSWTWRFILIAALIVCAYLFLVYILVALVLLAGIGIFKDILPERKKQ